MTLADFVRRIRCLLEEMPDERWEVGWRLKTRHGSLAVAAEDAGGNVYPLAKMEVQDAWESRVAFMVECRNSLPVLLDEIERLASKEVK